jgi:hypothetical protein
VALLICLSAGAAELEKLAREGIDIEYPRGFKSEAGQTADLYAAVRGELERVIGIAPAEPVQVRLCATAADFNAITGGRVDPATLGLAYPADNWIVINCSRLGEAGYSSLAITVRHELCHLAIAAVERAHGRPVPYWFNEGLAVYTSGRLPLPGQGWLPTYVSPDVAIPLIDLTTSFPETPAGMQVAYEQSVSIIRFLTQKYPGQPIVRICTNVAAGQTFEEAVQNVTGQTVAQLEQEWLESLGPTSTVIAFVLRNFGLFTLAAILSIVAFVHYLIRRRAAMRRWEREEDGFPRDFQNTGQN